MNTMKVEHAVFINVPVEETFVYMSNLENIADWSGFVISIRKISPGETLVGTAVQCTVRIFGRRFDTAYEIVECKPNRYFSYKSIMSFASSFTYIRFEPQDSGTNVMVEIMLHFVGGYLGYDETLVANAISRQIASDLQTLKDLLEITSSHCSNTE